MNRHPQRPMLLLCVIVGVLLCSTFVSAQEAVDPADSDDSNTPMCYQFTWINNKNFTDCKEKNKEKIPCYTPFIWTDPPYYPPNITDLDYFCTRVKCDTYKCPMENGQQCLRYVLYDVNNKPQYMTLFCGSMVDTTHVGKPGYQPPTLYDKCYLQPNDTTIIEGCSCGTNLCNHAPGGWQPHSIRTLLLATSLAILGVALQTRV